MYETFMNLKPTNKLDGLTILEDNRKDTGWIHGIVHGRSFAAKLYDEPSTYGIDSGRISKLSIYKTDQRDPNIEFFSQLDFNYDRGLDFNHLWKSNRKLYFKIIKTIEQIPPIGSSND